MTEVSRKLRQMLLHIDPFPVPAQQRLDRKAAAKIVQPRAMTIRYSPQANLSRELDEGGPYGTGGQTRALLGDE